MKKYYYEGPTFNFETSPGVLFLNFEGGSWVLGPRVLKSWVPRSWSYFYTMPLLASKTNKIE